MQRFALLLGVLIGVAFCDTAGAYYHAQLGRFVSRDPIGYQGGDRNLHGYVESRPTVSRDPFGLQHYGPVDGQVYIFFDVGFGYALPSPDQIERQGEEVAAAEQQKLYIDGVGLNRQGYQWAFEQQFHYLSEAQHYCCQKFKLACGVRFYPLINDKDRFAWDTEQAKKQAYRIEWSDAVMQEMRERAKKNHGVGVVVGGVLDDVGYAGIHQNGAIHLSGTGRGSRFTLAHEFGHVLGYRGDRGSHTSDKNCIMHNSVKDTSPLARPDRQWCELLEDYARKTAAVQGIVY